jgi:tetratricopeptide (TPR) repeat protein
LRQYIQVYSRKFLEKNETLLKHEIREKKGSLAMGLDANIRRRRKELNMTQAQLAEGIISVPYLSLIENGKAIPGPEILKLLAGRLNTTVENLLGITDESIRKKARQLINEIQSWIHCLGFEQAEKQMNKLKELSQSIADPQLIMEIELLEIELWVSHFKNTKYSKLMNAFENKWEDFLSDPFLAMRYYQIRGKLEIGHSQFQKALYYFKQAKKYTRHINDQIEIAFLYGNIGRTLLFLSNPGLSIVYLEKAFQTMLSHDRWLEMCNYLNLMGRAYRQTEEYDEAIPRLERVVEISQRYPLPDSILCQTYHELGLCYLALDQEEKAIEHLEKALEPLSQDHFNEQKGLIHQSMALVYLKNGELDKAEEQIHQACHDLQCSEVNLADCWIILGNIRHAQHRWQEFIQNYQKALATYSSWKLAQQVVKTSYTLAEFFHSQGSEKEAFHYYLKATHWFQLLNG